MLTSRGNAMAGFGRGLGWGAPVLCAPVVHLPFFTWHCEDGVAS
jgi:hypothetical protein